MPLLAIYVCYAFRTKTTSKCIYITYPFKRVSLDTP